MQKKELADGIIHYTFPPRRETSCFGDGIVAVVDDNEAVLIDAGYEDEAALVLDDLNKNGITIVGLVISHFHADHFHGMRVLPKVPVYGGAHYEETLVFEGYLKDAIVQCAPSIPIDKPTTIKVGKHALELIPIVGHSVCTMFVKIDDRFLYIADEIMFSTDGRLMLPYLCAGKSDIEQQLAAHKQLKDYAGLTIIPAHGPAFDGCNLQDYVRNLGIYLDAVLTSDGKVTYEDAVKNCDYPLASSHWHDANCK